MDLGTSINRLRGEKNVENLREVLDYCDGARIARNGLVHARANPGTSVEAFSLTIRTYLVQILGLALPWFAQMSPATKAKVEAAPDTRTIARVFLSTISPHLPRQEAFLRDLRAAMRTLGLEPVAVEPDEYDARDPVGKILATLRRCDALLCVGLARSHAYFLREKEGSAKELEVTHRFYTSAWLHLEAGAAFALGKPVIVLCEESIASDGVFDRSWNSSPPYQLGAGPLSIDDPVVERCLDRLVQQVRATQTAT
jgi:hypothetical protein